MNLKAIVVVEKTSMGSRQPAVFPAAKRNLFKTLDSPDYPDIYVTVFNNATTFGLSNIISHDGNYIIHDLINTSSDILPEEFHRRITLDGEYLYDIALGCDYTGNVNVAASFLDATSSNYAHWLTEVLPRVAAFCSINHLKNVPLLIDLKLHENLISALEKVVEPERLVYLVKPNTQVRVERLYQTSVCGYVPFMNRYPSLGMYNSHGRFSATAIRKVHDLLWTSVEGNNAPEKMIPSDPSKTKIFIVREGTNRCMTNAGLIQSIAEELGFIPVLISGMSIEEQMAVFRNANAVISATGAALANMIFCKPDTKCLILIGDHPAMIFRYWSNLLSQFEIDLTYCVGKIDIVVEENIHSSYYIDPDIFRSAVHSMIND